MKVTAPRCPIGPSASSWRTSESPRTQRTSASGGEQNERMTRSGSTPEAGGSIGMNSRWRRTPSGAIP